ncbi:MAG: recombinase family protein [Ignavibacteriales bacterium]|nr:recombinase family protein [Ignavibacteriales bacterium]
MKTKFCNVIDMTKAPYSTCGVGIKKGNPKRCLECGARIKRHDTWRKDTSAEDPSGYGRYSVIRHTPTCPRSSGAINRAFANKILRQMKHIAVTKKGVHEMKAVIYARTAIKEKPKMNDGNGIEAQIDAGKRYAEESGFKVTDVFIDKGFSGERLDRPSLNKMRALISHGCVDVVIVCNLSRLTRSLSNSITLKRQFTRHGAKIHSVEDEGRK